MTSAAVTTRPDLPPVQFGHNRDWQTGPALVVYGVLADSMGRPLAVQAYAGNTGDPTTVPDQVEKVRGRFGLQRVVWRGLLTGTQHLKRHPGLGWVSALRHHQIRRLVESEAVQLSLFDERHLAEVRSPSLRTTPASGSSSATTRCWPSIGGRSGRVLTALSPKKRGRDRPSQVARRTRTPSEIAETRPRQEPLPGGSNTSGIAGSF